MKSFEVARRYQIIVKKENSQNGLCKYTSWQRQATQWRAPRWPRRGYQTSPTAYWRVVKAHMPTPVDAAAAAAAADDVTAHVMFFFFFKKGS